MIIKRLLGLVILVTALVGLVASCAVVVVGQRAFDMMTGDIDANLTSLSSTLDTVSQTLQLAQMTTSQVVSGLDTAEKSVRDTAQAIVETRPLVTETGTLLTVDVANSIDTVQSTIPNLAQLAGSIDKSLTLLSKVNILGFGLGINYNPSEPLDQSINAIGKSFNGIPAKLRGMSGNIATTERNLDTMATNLTTIGSNLHAINTSLAQFTELFNTYQATALTAHQRLQAIQAELHASLQTVKMGLVVFFIWLALAQLAPLYIGVRLLSKPETV